MWIIGQPLNLATSLQLYSNYVVLPCCVKLRNERWGLDWKIMANCVPKTQTWISVSDILCWDFNNCSVERCGWFKLRNTKASRNCIFLWKKCKSITIRENVCFKSVKGHECVYMRSFVSWVLRTQGKRRLLSAVSDTWHKFKINASTKKMLFFTL